MTKCLTCEEHAARVAEVNAEPRRIIAFRVDYETEVFVAREPDLEAIWSSMPEDGFQKATYVYNHRNVGRDGTPGKHLKGQLSGCDWYWLWVAVDGSLVVSGDTGVTKEEVEQRYPGAVVKRGRWTSPAIIERINSETFDGD